MGILKPIVAKALAALHATEFNRDLGTTKNNCKRWHAKSCEIHRPQLEQIDQLVEDTQGVVNGMNSWCICHVRWDANSPVYSLAKAAIKQIIDDVWMEEIPNCICNFVLLE